MGSIYLVASVGIIQNRKGWNLSLIKNYNFFQQYFNLSCGYFQILIRSLADNAFRLDHIFPSQFADNFLYLRRCSFVCNKLCNPIAVP